jgi:hypothetical protein
LPLSGLITARFDCRRKWSQHSTFQPATKIPAAAVALVPHLTWLAFSSMLFRFIRKVAILPHTVSGI